MLIVDETWAMALKRAAVARLTPAYMAGLFLPFYLNWLLWTQVGALSGALVRDPERFGIDFLYVAIFLTLLTQSWKGCSAVAPVAASAAASQAAYQVLPGATYIIAGGVDGALGEPGGAQPRLPRSHAGGGPDRHRRAQAVLAGVAETIACAVTVAVATRAPLLVAVAAGTATVAALRAVLA